MTQKSLVRGLLLSGAALAALGSAAAADKYEVDGAHTFVLFKVSHLGVGTAYGQFNDVSGTLTVDEENPAGSSVAFEIKAGSVDTHNEKRDEHLRSPDFLSAVQFPLITFKSTGVKKSGEKSYEVSGDLTLRGVTKPVTAKLERVGSGKDPWGNYRTGFDGSFVIKRSDFGVNFMPEALGQDVTILLAVEGIKK